MPGVLYCCLGPVKVSVHPSTHKNIYPSFPTTFNCPKRVKKMNMRRKVATSGEEKRTDELKFKETKMRSNNIGVLATVNVLKNKSKKTACPWRIFASRIEAGYCSNMRSTS